MMLNSRLVLLLLALHSSLSLKKDTRLGKKTFLPKPTNCDKIKCPPVERPVCAKLVYRHAAGAGNNSVHVVMINECEMNYAKCHQGLEAIIVPMGNCGHEDFLKTGSKRSKRQVENDIYQQMNSPTQENIQNIVPEHRGEEHEKPEPENEDYEEATTNSDIDAPSDVNGAPSDYEGNGGDGSDLEDYNVEQAEDLGSKSAELIIFGKDIEGVTKKDNFDSINKESVDKEQYSADCPTVCPSRDVMVCARCQHGVYRTFLTICHMRMFTCRYTDEKLQLISRLSCVMSAPYLSGAGMQPRGRVQEPSDDDRVMRFIRCRELPAESREEDSRCKLKDEKYTRLYEETINIDDA